jgi:hypothetical protein
MILSSLSIYVVFEDAHQGNNDVMPFLPTTKAYVEFIGRKKARAYLQCTYCKVKQWIKKKNVIRSNQDVHVCRIFDGYIWWIT